MFRIRVIESTSWNFALRIEIATAFSSTTDENWQILPFFSFTVSFISSFPFHLNVLCWNDRSELATLQTCGISQNLLVKWQECVFRLLRNFCRSTKRHRSLCNATGCRESILVIHVSNGCRVVHFRFKPIIRSYFYHFYTVCVPQDDAVCRQIV